jgi:hypothetical protein
VNKKDIDPANVQIRPMREEDVNAIAASDSVCFGAPRPEYFRKKPGSAIGGAGINTSLVSEARTAILEAECKR